MGQKEKLWVVSFVGSSYLRSAKCLEVTRSVVESVVSIFFALCCMSALQHLLFLDARETVLSVIRGILAISFAPAERNFVFTLCFFFYFFALVSLALVVLNTRRQQQQQ